MDVRLCVHVYICSTTAIHWAVVAPPNNGCAYVRVCTTTPDNVVSDVRKKLSYLAHNIKPMDVHVITENHIFVFENLYPEKSQKIRCELQLW